MTAAPQHMVALEGANRVRLGRAEMHRTVAALPRPAGCLRIAEMLKDPPALIETMAITDLLQWIHRVGRSQARGILMHADRLAPIGENRQIRALTDRQRQALADHLRAGYESACPTVVPR
jgi:hypothetical protein